MAFSCHSCLSAHSFLFKVRPPLPGWAEGSQGTPSYMDTFCIIPAVLITFGGIIRWHKYPWIAKGQNTKRNKLNHNSKKVSLVVIGKDCLFLYISLLLDSMLAVPKYCEIDRLYFCARQVQEIPQIYWQPIVQVSHPSVFQAKEACISIQTSAAYRSVVLNVLRIVDIKTYFSLLAAGWIISTLLKLGLDSWEWRKKNQESSQWSKPRNICWTHWFALFIKLAASASNHKF